MFSGYDSQMSTLGTHVASVRSKSHKIPDGGGNSADRLFSSPSSPLNSPSLLAQLKAIMSRSKDNLFSHGLLMSHNANEDITDKFQGMLGSNTVVGLDVEHKRLWVDTL
ncbi:hypothetical protein Hanom_Chr07g00588161 [Helianthus anomalus]